MTTSTPVNAADAASIADVWIQAIIAIVTLVGIVASIWIARSGQKADLHTATKEADRAERADAASQAASERAEAASRLSIDAMTRIANALEALASDGIRVGDQAPNSARTTVSWALKHFNGDMYLLENTGDAIAYQVTLTADPSLLRFPKEWESTPVVKPGEAVRFGALRTMGTRDSTIAVNWRDEPEGEEQTWRYPLPPRPPRR